MRLVWLAVPFVTGCCPTVYTPSLVTVLVDAAALDDGTWTFDATAVDASNTCDLVLPEGTGTCDPGFVGEFDGTFHLSMFQFTPDAFDLEVAHDGDVVTVGTFTPEYARSRPYGARCGVVRAAEVRVEL